MCCNGGFGAMIFLYTLFMAFLLVFFSELGDKTQLIVLSFSTKLRASTILLGVGLGSFFSHGVAILFGSFLGNVDNEAVHHVLEIISYASFIILGIISFIPTKEKSGSEDGFIHKISGFKVNYVLIIATAIAFGELGDKTFLASLGLGINYPDYRLWLVLGSVLGMIVSNIFAIGLGKFLSTKIPEKTISRFSGLLFIIFGLIGFATL